MPFYLYEPCGVCGRENNVTMCPSIDAYIPLRECIYRGISPEYRLADEMMAKYIKKNLCNHCRTSINVFCKSKVKHLKEDYCEQEIEIISTEWITIRLRSIIRNRYKV